MVLVDGVIRKGGTTYFEERFDDVVPVFVVHEDGEGEGAEFADAAWRRGEWLVG